MEDLYTYGTDNYFDSMGDAPMDSALSSLTEGSMTVFAVITVITMIVMILQIVAKWKIFSKAGARLGSPHSVLQHLCDV